MSDFHVHRLKLQLLGADESDEPGDDLVEALDLGGNHVDVLAGAVEFRRRILASFEAEHGADRCARVPLLPQQVLPDELEMNRHRVQRIPDFVRHAGHQPPERPRRELLADRLERFADAFELFVGRQIDAGRLSPRVPAS